MAWRAEKIKIVSFGSTNEFLKIFAISAALLFSACGPRHYSFSESEFVARQVTVGDKTYSFRVYVPQKRSPNAKVPVMLFLHGSGARGDDNHSQAEWFDADIAP